MDRTLEVHMKHTLRLAVSALWLTLPACADYSGPPPIEPTLRLTYPLGMTADLPHQTPGTTITLAAAVRSSKGKPVEGVRVIWDDGQAFNTIQPPQSLTDTLGIATAQYVTPPLQGDQGTRDQVLHAYLPGADGNPLVYRLEIVPCTRC